MIIEVLKCDVCGIERPARDPETGKIRRPTYWKITVRRGMAGEVMDACSELCAKKAAEMCLSSEHLRTLDTSGQAGQAGQTYPHGYLEQPARGRTS